MPNRNGWLAYWDGEVSLYVSPRHLEAHYQGLLAHIEPLLPPGSFTLLDYGCGDALMAPAIAGRGGRVVLFDQAVSRRSLLRQRFQGNAAIAVPDDLSGLEGACDLILMISVIQYIPREVLPEILGQLRRCLAPGGRLVVGDIIGPGGSAILDALALLRFGLEQGFFWDALAGLFKTLRSDYRRQRQQSGLVTYQSAEITAVLAAAGLEAAPLAANIGHAGDRYSLIASSRTG